MVGFLSSLRLSALKGMSSMHSSHCQIQHSLSTLVKKDLFFSSKGNLSMSKQRYQSGRVLSGSCHPDWGASMTKANYHQLVELFSEQGPPLIYQPSSNIMRDSNMAKLMAEKKISSVQELYQWSVDSPDTFWKETVSRLSIQFSHPYSMVFQQVSPTHRRWFPDSRLNIVDSCFNCPSHKTAIIEGREGDSQLSSLSYGALSKAVDNVAFQLSQQFQKGDVIGLIGSMTTQSVVAYLAIIKAGLVCSPIPDSFSQSAIVSRLQLTSTKAVIVEGSSTRGGKIIDTYSKLNHSEVPLMYVYGDCRDGLREGDQPFEVLECDVTGFESIPCSPQDGHTIICSSGTTGTPKAIPWDHTTPIKSASDAYYHHNISDSSVVAWPTNMGWMMGPWLTFSTLINGGTMALYNGSPTQLPFLNFVDQSQVTMLGLIPSIVRQWVQQGYLEGTGFPSVEAFSSTGECSDPDYYVELARFSKFQVPIIEYLGGTEIGGAYITGSVNTPMALSSFSMPALGTACTFLDGKDQPLKQGETGEAFLSSGDLGHSSTLVNTDLDHDEIYFSDTPLDSQGYPLRRHGDLFKCYPNGVIRAQGRADDFGNLGGIKVSPIPFEEAVNNHPSVSESAAIFVAPKTGGPEELVMVVVLSSTDLGESRLKQDLQQYIRSELGPLFKLSRVRIVDSLPKTPSNKIKRKALHP